MKGLHGGHITSLAWLCQDLEGEGGFGDLLLSGAQDGYVRVWDPRVGGATPVAKVGAHVAAGGSGSGAVGDIAVAKGGGGGGGGALGYAVSQHGEGGLVGGLGEPLIVTAGADKMLQVLDPRGGWRVRSTLKGHKVRCSLACFFFLPPSLSPSLSRCIFFLWGPLLLLLLLKC